MKQALRILRKESREALRDRSLVVHLFLIPLFLYPFLGFSAWQVFLLIQGATEKTSNLVYLDEKLPAALVDSLKTQENLHFAPLPQRANFDEGKNFRQQFRDLREVSGSDPLQAVVLRESEPGIQKFIVLFDSSRDRSARAKSQLSEVLNEYVEHQRNELGRSAGMSAGDLEPLVISAKDTASKRQVGSYVLSLLVPVLLVIMLPQGAYYSTLDTVVGERERGTLETLVTSPLTRGEILLGKFLFVTLSSLVSFLLNFASLAIFLAFALKLMGLQTAFNLQLGLGEALLVVGVALLTSAFLAAAMMIAAVPCKNYREGQSALMPLYLIPALAGIVIAAQGDQLSTVFALIPVVNVAALLRETIRGHFDLQLALLSLGSLTLLTALFLGYAARIGRREEILFDPGLTLRRLLRGQRRTR
jgi:sodium transport system permease protein